MTGKTKWAFILDSDEFVRLSLNKILKKYGFETEEIEDLSQLEGRKREIETGMILADLEIEELEKGSPWAKKWNSRFILMASVVTDEFILRLKNIGIRHILKKPVEPKRLKHVVREIFPDEEMISLGGKRRSSRFKEKGGEDG
jgi:DNA-binding NtrC family response regulator